MLSACWKFDTECLVLKEFTCESYWVDEKVIKVLYNEAPIGLDKGRYLVNIFSYFSMKTYVVGTH